MKIFTVEERETRTINLANDLTKHISIHQIDMVPGVEMSEKRSRVPKGALKIMG